MIFITLENDTWSKTERFVDNVVLNLSAPYLIRRKNVTTNNFFISLKLAEALKNQPALVGKTEHKSPNKYPTCEMNGSIYISFKTTQPC